MVLCCAAALEGAFLPRVHGVESTRDGFCEFAEFWPLNPPMQLLNVVCSSIDVPAHCFLELQCQ
jgi:hypothetical protein